jgi:hypothetical protein
LALYNAEGVLIGAIGVSGDSSCADHNIAWKVRHALELDYLPGGVSLSGDDNIVNDFKEGASVGGWGHPSTTPESAAIAKDFPKTHPVRKKK